MKIDSVNNIRFYLAKVIILGLLTMLVACQSWPEFADDTSKLNGQPVFVAPKGLDPGVARFYMTSTDRESIGSGNYLLSNKEIKPDKADLLTALRTGYVGSHFIPKNAFTRALKDIEKIRGPINRYSFLNELRKILFELPDRHISVTTIDEIVPNDVHVRKNKVFRKPPEHWWKLEIRVIENKNWHVLTLADFPHIDDPLWIEFYRALDTITQSDGLIIDLRNNPGGFTSSAHQLQKYLRGSKSLARPSTQHFLRHPLVSILRMNKINDDFGGRHTEISLNRIKSQHELLQYYLDKPTPLIESVPQRLPLDIRPYHPVLQKIKLFLVVGSGCISSCEVFLNNLQKEKDVVSIGQNTAGIFHFGTTGLLFLKQSGLKVFLASDFDELSSKQFIEGVGFKPEFEVNSSATLDEAFVSYLKSKK